MQQELKQVAYLRNQAEAVGWAVKNKVTTPKSAKEFDSMSRCTYEQIITYIYNALK